MSKIKSEIKMAENWKLTSSASPFLFVLSAYVVCAVNTMLQGACRNFEFLTSIF